MKITNLLTYNKLTYSYVYYTLFINLPTGYAQISRFTSYLIIACNLHGKAEVTSTRI